MIGAYKRFWEGFGDFQGYSKRSDYWWNVLWTVLIIGFAFLVSIGYFAVIGSKDIWHINFSEGIAGGSALAVFPSIWGLGITLYCLAIAVPWIALQIRRLRDAGFQWAIILFYVFLGLGTATSLVNVRLTLMGYQGLVTFLYSLLGLGAVFFFVLSQFPTKKAKE